MVSDAFKTSAFGDETDEVWIVLATISHDDLTDDIRVVNNLEDITSNGDTYIGCPFEIVLPDSTDQGPPSARVQIDDVSMDLREALRELDSPVSFNIKVVSASDPDTVEVEYSGLTLRGVTISDGLVRGQLGLDDLRLEAFPVHAFAPSLFPSLF